MKLAPITVEEFCSRFFTKPKLLCALLVANCDSDDEMSILSQLKRGGHVSLNDIFKLDFQLQYGILRIFDREMYANDCMEREKQNLIPQVLYPLVDKSTDLVFDVMPGIHLFVKEQLMDVYCEEDISVLDIGTEYILRGYGYFCTQASNDGMAIGGSLLKSSKFDKYDTAILQQYKIVEIESSSDFQKLKGRY